VGIATQECLPNFSWLSLGKFFVYLCESCGAWGFGAPRNIQEVEVYIIIVIIINIITFYSPWGAHRP
jgi:hypothetical protein